MSKYPRSPVLRKYDDAREFVEDGSLLLYRGGGLISGAIEAAGRSPYSHAALAAWIRRTPRSRGVLVAAEVREGVGARAVNLSTQIAKYPAGIDVYRPSNSFRATCNVSEMATEMIRLTGQDYGYWAVCKAAMQYVPFVRWFAKKDWGKPTEVCGDLDCSGTIDYVFFKHGGVKLVPNTEHGDVTPGDLGRCPFFDYEFTLV